MTSRPKVLVLATRVILLLFDIVILTSGGILNCDGVVQIVLPCLTGGVTMTRDTQEPSSAQSIRTFLKVGT